MRQIQYGTTAIFYRVRVRDELKHHYVCVDREDGVVLEGKAVGEAIADQLILKRAAWILDKLDLVLEGKDEHDEDFITGSRLYF